ncbi:MAG TPA: hypothetical protein PLQ80_07095 [Candidatus Syntrophosphaera sp.]|nr:hypothetical protein [Candidatus Syntrophosphaera sp.]
MADVYADVFDLQRQLQVAHKALVISDVEQWENWPAAGRTNAMTDFCIGTQGELSGHSHNQEKWEDQ